MPIWLFAIGVIHTPLYPYPLPSFSLLACACLLGIVGYKWRCKKGRMAYLAMFFALGASLGSWHLNQVCNNQLSPQFEGSIQNIRFQVVSLSRFSGKSDTFTVQVLNRECSVTSCADIVGDKIRLSWYYPIQSIKPGQIWDATVKLKRPRGFVNPRGFDYQAWLLSQRLAATGYVRAKDGARPKLVSTEFVWAQVRQNTKDRLLKGRKGQFDRFWAALLVGDKSSIHQGDWAILQTTGTVHLMAISGLHIGLVALWCFGFGAAIARFWACITCGSGVFIDRFLPPLASISGALFYAALAGFSVPTLRALMACLIVNICMMAGVRISAFTILAICLAVVGLMEPLAWSGNGFWLSFVAVGLLVYCVGSRKGGKNRWAWVKMQVVLSIGMMLPLIFIGQGVSLVSPFANLIAVPVVSLLIVPCLLLASLVDFISQPFAQWILQCLDTLFSWLWGYLHWLQTSPFSRWWSSQPLSLGLLILGFIGCLLLIAPKGVRFKFLGVVWLLVAARGELIPREKFRLTVMDVGQGLSVVVTTPQFNWVYDTGPKFTEQFDSGSRIIAPYMRALGLSETSLIVSHDDNDHSGGTQGLISALTVGDFYSGEAIKSVVRQSKQCFQGQAWQEGSLAFHVLWPPQNSGYEGNKSSCVIYMQYKNGLESVDVLFTGDMDKSVEKRILGLLPTSVDILIAPHHGSNSSSSREFIKKINPSHVVFSTGFNNRYHHPSFKVVKRYQQAGVATHNTADDGAVVFTLNQESHLSVSKTREAEHKRWYLTPPSSND